MIFYKIYTKFCKSLRYFDKTLCNPLKLETKNLENVLQKSLEIIDIETLNEIRIFVKKQLTPQGGFANKAGNCDLYYTLFGFYLADTLRIPEIKISLTKYIKSINLNELTGIHLFCAAILYIKLIGHDSNSKLLKSKIIKEIKNNKNISTDYKNFLGLLSLYYFKDYWNLYKFLRAAKNNEEPVSKICSVVSAKLVLNAVLQKAKQEDINYLLGFYRNNGGFAALPNAPAEDLLSTAVALFALHFVDANIKHIKSDCLSFIDLLYNNGGFQSVITDNSTDLEYTFYGLLALGAIND